MRNRPYIIRKEREGQEKFFKLFLKKLLTKGIFSAILHINNTDNTVHTVDTVVLFCVWKNSFQRGEEGSICNLLRKRTCTKIS